jgi:sugar lactone lactonase YvrE
MADTDTEIVASGFMPLPGPGFELGESPVWEADQGALLWADILAGTIHELVIETGARRSWQFDGPVGSLGLARSGRLVVACGRKVGLFDRATGAFTEVAAVEPEAAPTRLNDGKVGPDGAFWVGSMDNTGQRRPIGALYRVTASGRVERKLDGLITSNGLAWSADGASMFHADTSGRWIERWRFDAARGDIADRVRIATPDQAMGRPDGGATDAEGFYWSAGVSAGCLNRYAPDGRLVARIDLPVAAPTMPCFGGADSRTMFVTSLRKGLDEAALERSPLSGRILTARMAVAGVAVNFFAD